MNGKKRMRILISATGDAWISNVKIERDVVAADPGGGGGDKGETGVRGGN